MTKNTNSALYLYYYLMYVYGRVFVSLLFMCLVSEIALYTSVSQSVSCDLLVDFCNSGNHLYRLTSSLGFLNQLYCGINFNSSVRSKAKKARALIGALLGGNVLLPGRPLMGCQLILGLPMAFTPFYTQVRK